MKTHVGLLFLALFLIAPEAVAKDNGPTPAQTVAKSPIVQAAEDFTKGFDDDSRRHFTIIYSNYNMLKVVETVQDDVELAVEKCGEVNADMKEPLETRHKVWKGNIKPVLADAEQNVNNMVLSQDYAKPKDIKVFFKQIDKERKVHDKEVKKMPVTSKEACEYLLKTMDSTEDQLVSLLQATLVSAPQSVQKALDDKAAAEKQAAEKAAADAKAEPVNAKQEKEPAAKEAEEALPAKPASPATE